MKDTVAARVERVEEVLKAAPMHLKQLAAHLREPEHRVRYALETLVFLGKAHIGSWTEHVAGDGKARLAAVYHHGPGIPVQPPRGRRTVADAGAAFNRHSDLNAVMKSWANTGLHEPEEEESP